MANIRFLIVLSIVALATAEDQVHPEPPPISPSNSTTVAPNSTTTHHTTHPTTTLPPSTISPSTPSPNTTSTSSTTPPTPTKSTTPIPPTTKPTSPTPTTKPTSPTPTTKPTSPTPTTKPTPSPTPSPSPTPKPTPIPDPTTGNWSVNFTNSNSICIVIDAALQIEILHANSSEKINIPTNATAKGTCNNKTDLIGLTWGQHSLAFDFERNDSDSKFELKWIKATLVNLTLPNEVAKDYTLIHNSSEFGTPLGHSYKCVKVQTLNLTEENKNVTIGYLHISHVQMQAFTNVTQHKFGDAIDCEASSITSDVVPIVVGCVLAALVIMIMVAYLFARRRCQARGYLSMESQPDD